MIEIPEDGWGGDALTLPGSLLGGGAALDERSFAVPDWDGAAQADDPVNADSTRERAGAVFQRQRSVGAFNRGLDELAAGIAEAPDWNDDLARFDRKVEELRQRHGGDLQGSDDREAFARHAGEFAAMQRIGLKRALVERQASDALTQLDDQLAYYAGKAAGADHDVFRQLALDSGMRAIEELQEAGYLASNAAEERKAAFLEQIDGATKEVTTDPTPIVGPIESGPSLNDDAGSKQQAKQLAMGRQRRFGSPLPPHRGDEIIEGTGGRGSGAPGRPSSAKPVEPGNDPRSPVYPDHAPSPGQLQTAKRLWRTGKGSAEQARESLTTRIREHEEKIRAGKELGKHTSSMESELRNFKEQINAIDMLKSKRR